MRPNSVICKIALSFFLILFSSSLLFSQNINKANKFHKQGYTHFSNKEYYNAIECFKKAIQFYPEAANSYYMIGNSYQELEQYNNALVNYTKAISLDDDNAGWYNSKAWSRCFIGENLDEAIEEVNKAIELVEEASSKAAYLDTRATAFALQKKYAQALSDFNSAIALEQSAIYCYKRGLIKKKMNNLGGAELDFEKAKSLDETMAYKNLQDPLFFIFNDKIDVDKNPPTITLINPDLSRGFKIIEQHKKITIQGIVDDASGIYEVLVNGEDAYVDAQGNFTKTVLLAFGINYFRVSATDLKQNTASKEFEIERISDQEELVLAESPRSDSNTETGEYYALIIGVQDYDDPDITDLDQPLSDAQRVYQVLTSTYTFETENVAFLKNPSKNEITKSLDFYFGSITENDNLLVFYAGHGYWDENFEQGYWLSADADRNNRGTWLSNGTLRDYMRAIPAKHSLLITDACFGGGIFKSRDAFANASVAINVLFDLPSRKAMTSGALKEVPDKSVFVEYLVKRLEQNTETYLSSEQLFASFKIAVINNSSNGQAPQFGEVKETGDEGGDFIFIKKN
jgi:Tfp pilus assembly protein PilF